MTQERHKRTKQAKSRRCHGQKIFPSNTRLARPCWALKWPWAVWNEVALRRLRTSRMFITKSKIPLITSAEFWGKCCDAGPLYSNTPSHVIDAVQSLDTEDDRDLQRFSNVYCTNICIFIIFNTHTQRLRNLCWVTQLNYRRIVMFYTD